MKKLNLVLLSIIFISISGIAQKYSPEIIYNGTPKQTIVVDYFVPSSYGVDSRDYHFVDYLRTKALEGAATVASLNLINADDNIELRAYDPAGVGTLEYMRNRYDLISKLGANYTLECNVDAISASRVPNSKLWKAALSYDVKIIDPQTGNVLFRSACEPKDCTSTNENPSKAISSACDGISSRVRALLLDNIRTIGQIVEVADVNKKEEPQHVYINLGNANGVQTGNKFEVHSVKIVSGSEASKKIGEVKIEEIQGADISFAKVTKGNKAIKEIVDAGGILKLVSNGSSFWDIF